MPKHATSNPPYSQKVFRPKTPSSTASQTTNVLTATTLIYASRAGITAAAGTRPFPRLVFTGPFETRPFQRLNGQKSTSLDIPCHYLVLSTLGNFRACCHPWMYEPSLRLILRSRTLILR